MMPTIKMTTETTASTSTASFALFFSTFYFTFYDASSQSYKRVCLSVSPSASSSMIQSITPVKSRFSAAPPICSTTPVLLHNRPCQLNATNSTSGPTSGLVIFVLSSFFPFSHSFLQFFSRGHATLYTLLCRSVGKKPTFQNCERFSHYCKRL